MTTTPPPGPETLPTPPPTTNVGYAGAPAPFAYPVRLEIDIPERSNRFYAIPLIGYLVKSIILIPHLIIVYVLLLVVSLLQLVLWIPVLFTGRYPSWGVSLVGGTIRWLARFQCFFFGLTDRYPPFSLSR